MSIGYNNPAGFRVLPKIIPAFREKWPNTHLTFHRLGTSAEQLERLRQDELDVGFAWLPAPEEEFDALELSEEPLVVALCERHRLASLPSVSIVDLSHEPLILFIRALDPQTYHQIEQLFARVGVVLNVAYELDTALSMINFTATGSGCSLLPDYARGLHRDGIVYKPLRAPNLVKKLAIIKKKRRGDLAEAFVRFTVDHLPALSPEPMDRLLARMVQQLSREDSGCGSIVKIERYVNRNSAIKTPASLGLRYRPASASHPLPTQGQLPAKEQNLCL